MRKLWHSEKQPQISRISLVNDLDMKREQVQTHMEQEDVPNGQLQPSRSIVGADERTSTQNFALLWLNLRCRYGRPLCAKRHVPSEVMDEKWVD